MDCRCSSFYSIPNMDGKRCRFAVHTEPALCGRVDRQPRKVDPIAEEWYPFTWPFDESDRGDEA